MPGCMQGPSDARQSRASRASGDQPTQPMGQPDVEQPAAAQTGSTRVPTRSTVALPEGDAGSAAQQLQQPPVSPGSPLGRAAGGSSALPSPMFSRFRPARGSSTVEGLSVGQAGRIWRSGSAFVPAGQRGIATPDPWAAQPQAAAQAPAEQQMAPEPAAGQPAAGQPAVRGTPEAAHPEQQSAAEQQVAPEPAAGQPAVRETPETAQPEQQRAAGAPAQPGVPADAGLSELQQPPAQGAGQAADQAAPEAGLGACGLAQAVPRNEAQQVSSPLAGEPRALQHAAPCLRSSVPS